MKFYVAELVATGIAFLCALANHAGACFVWRKLMPLDLWASNIMDQRGVNQLHRFESPVPIPDCHCRHHVTATSPNTATGKWHYCPTHGIWSRVA